MNVTVNETKKAPVLATLVCLGVAWLLFLIPIPGAGLFVGWPLNLVAFVLAIVVMVRGKTLVGILALLATLILSPIVYFIGLAIFGAAISSAPYENYKERAQTEASSGKPAYIDLSEAITMDVPAATLFKAYEANEVAADDSYKGKQLAVAGTVAAISKDFTDAVYVELDTGNQFASIHARDLDPAVAAGLSKGQRITVVCEGAGLVLGSPMLSNCVIRP